MSALNCPNATDLFFPKETLQGDNKSEKSEGLVNKWSQFMEHGNYNAGILKTWKTKAF